MGVGSFDSDTRVARVSAQDDNLYQPARIYPRTQFHNRSMTLLAFPGGEFHNRTGTGIHLT